MSVRGKYHTARSVSSASRHNIATKVWAAYRNRCYHCGILCHQGDQRDPQRGTLDHIFPASRGGRFAVDNLQLLCNVCNQAKANL